MACLGLVVATITAAEAVLAEMLPQIADGILAPRLQAPHLLRIEDSLQQECQDAAMHITLVVTYACSAGTPTRIDQTHVSHFWQAHVGTYKGD